MKTALITGIAGQDGSYLAELLLSKGYAVHGFVRPFAGKPEVALDGIRHIVDKIALHTGDISDAETVLEFVAGTNPDEIYHLATNHEVGITAKEYLESRRVNADSTMYFLSAIKDHRPNCRFFYASSSNVFGKTLISPQNENTSYSPESIYSTFKVAGMELVRLHRTQLGLFASSGILYNHESPRRALSYLPRKITSAAARIKHGLDTELEIGDIDAKKDWGYAGDYVEAIWRILQADMPDDFIIGSGELHSVREILDIAFGSLDLDWKQFVKINPAFIRPKANADIVADITKIKRQLGWAPKIQFKEMIIMMLNEDLKINQS